MWAKASCSVIVKPTRLISDADGVIVDSRSHAYENARKIVSLFSEIRTLESPADFDQHFSREAQVRLVGHDESETLRAMHRLLMRHSAAIHATFLKVIEVYERFNIPKIVVTSAYATGIAAALGEAANIFDEIKGREHGDKMSILQSVYSGSEIYVTDSVRDIAKCKTIGMPVIAVAWGYSPEDRLKAAGPEYFAANADELLDVLESLGVE